MHKYLVKALILAVCLGLSTPSLAGWGKVKNWFNEKVVNPTKKHVVNPVRQAIHDGGDYFSDRLGDSGAQGPRMHYESFRGDEKMLVVSDKEHEAYKGYIEHFTGNFFHFICHESVSSSLESPNYLFYPISKADYCRLKNQHLSNKASNLWDRSRNTEGCNYAYTTKNHKFFRCFNASLNDDAIKTYVNETFKEQHSDKIEQLKRLKNAYNSWATGHLEVLDRAQEITQSALDNATKKKEQFLNDVAAAQEILRTKGNELAKILSLIKARIHQFDEKHTQFLEQISPLKTSQIAIARFAALAINAIVHTDLSQDDFNHFEATYQALTDNEYRELCQTKEFEQTLLNLRVFHGNTRQILLSYLHQIDVLSVPQPVNISTFKTQLKAQAIPLEEVLSIKDQVYSSNYESLLNNEGSCAVHIAVGDLLAKRREIFMLVEKSAQSSRIRDEITAAVQQVTAIQEKQKIVAKAQADMQALFQPCLKYASNHRLMEATRECQDILAKLQRIQLDAMETLNDLDIESKSAVELLAKDYRDYENLHRDFIDKKLSSGFHSTVSKRRDSVLVKIFLVEQHIQSNPDLANQNILTAIHANINREFGAVIPRDLPHEMSEAELRAFDSKLAEVESVIDVLSLEYQLNIKRETL